MLAALRSLGFFPHLMVGTSSGGLVMLAYASGSQIDDIRVLNHLGPQGYDLNGGKKFIDYRRLSKGAPVLDLHGLVHHAFSVCVPINWQAMTETKTPFYLTATHYDGTGLLHTIHGINTEEMKQYAMDTSRIPFLAHPIHNDETLWDGGLSKPLPITDAFEIGADIVIALRTCEAKGQPKDGLMAKKVLFPIIKRYSEDIANLCLRRRELARAEHEKYHQSPDVLMAHPEKLLVGSLTTHTQRLWQQTALGWQAMFQALGMEVSPYPKSWPV